MIEPRLDVLPAPPVHADLAALAALAAANEHRAGRAVGIVFGGRQRLADAQASPPQHDDERTGSQAIRRLARAPHNRNDLRPER
jgi:hypothetical protein